MQEWGSWRAARRRRFRRRMRLSARRRRTARRRVAFHCAGVIAVSREVSLCPVPFWCCGNNAFRQIWKRHATPCASSPRVFSCRLSGSRTAYGPMSVSTSGGAMRRRRLQKTERRREYSPPSHAVDIFLPSKVFSQRFDCLRIVGSSGVFPPQTNPRKFQPFTNSLFWRLSATFGDSSNPLSKISPHLGTAVLRARKKRERQKTAALPPYIADMLPIDKNSAAFPGDGRLRPPGFWRLPPPRRNLTDSVSAGAFRLFLKIFARVPQNRRNLVASAFGFVLF